MDGIKIYDLYKSADLWRRTGERPSLKKSENPARDREIIFIFPDTASVQQAIREHQAGEGGIKSYIEYFKLLRAEMYLGRESRP